MPNLPITAKFAQVFIQAFLGYPDWQNELGVNFALPQTETAAVLNKTTFPIPANTTNNSCAVATFFPAAANCIFVALFDLTTPNQIFLVTTTSGSGKITISPGGIYCYTPNGGVPPTFFLDNPASSQVSEIGVLVISQ